MIKSDSAKIHPITAWLTRKEGLRLTVYLSVAAFCTYACMYGIRKPFTVGGFQGYQLLGIDFKAFLIISQVVGYALSKFIGIKVISEMGKAKRAYSIVLLTVIAEFSLILFGIVPAPYNFIFIFFNGLPLGMIWGLVFAYLEGRQNTEILGTILSISFIVSSGFVKSIGKMVQVGFAVNEYQMPWITGIIFLIPLIIFVWFLDKAPEPTQRDEELRTKRIPMTKSSRKKMFREFATGLVLLTLAYILLTIFRDLRDNFAAEIWKSIGITENSMIFTWSELPIALIVLFVMASIMLIKNNKKAFLINNYIVLLGFVIIGTSSLALHASIINPAAWMILLGLGIYMGYLPFNSLLFDRMIAAFGSAANAGFLIYIADSFGYLGSVGTLIYKNFFSKNISWYHFIINASYGLALAGGLLVIIALWYYKIKFKSTQPATVESVANLEIATL